MFPGLHPMAMMSTLGAPGYPTPPRGGPQSSPFGMYGPSQSYLAPPVMYPQGGGGGGQGGMNHSAGNAPPIPANLGANLPGDQKETVFVYIPNTAVGAII